MFGIVKGLLQLPGRVLLKQPNRCKLDASNMYDKLKFEFTEQNLCRAKDLLSNYPEKEQRGALLPLLDLAQRQYGWLPITAIKAVADMIKVDHFEAWEVAYYYTMFRQHPEGKYRLTVCTSTPCYLRGGDVILNTCKEVLQLKENETSSDMQFTLKTACCYGACVNAPVLGINDDIYEDLTVSELECILDNLKQDVIPPAGPRSGRFCSEPISGPTTLLIEPPPAGFGMQELCKPKKC
ncbi:NADH-quinone oxidoreductase subunit E [Drosophila nasuta]|uniref:NADH-quinone oxidoreductase subunit E n=1 Tax=Drosophila nasuta TaxID=42062 RepID=UPI00295E76D0|nr:NADH-quinone oxidoreductase subunit E [Drosophila nasuta]